MFVENSKRKSGVKIEKYERQLTVDENIYCLVSTTYHFAVKCLLNYVFIECRRCTINYKLQNEPNVLMQKHSHKNQNLNLSFFSFCSSLNFVMSFSFVSSSISVFVAMNLSVAHNRTNARHIAKTERILWW